MNIELPELININSIFPIAVFFFPIENTGATAALDICG